jgi:hypothetical protein
MGVKAGAARVRAFKALNWTSSPGKAAPHGVTGVVMLLLGAALIYGSLTGQLVHHLLTNALITLLSAVATTVCPFLSFHMCIDEIRYEVAIMHTSTC